MRISNFGQDFKVIFGSVPEISVHPHSTKEKGELFSAVDTGSTEIETLNFINSLVYSYKPNTVLETGTMFGYGTIAISHAMECNGFGKVFTVDINREFIDKAVENVSRVGLSSRVQFFQGNSLDLIETWTGDKFDLVFFDSELNIRSKEFELIINKDLLSNEAICIFHDTSATRELTYTADLEYVDFVNSLFKKYEGIHFPLSRGFHLFRIR